MIIEAVFIDRDGTIGGGDQVIYPGAFSLYPFVEESIKLLKSKGVQVYSFTNQPGISRGEAKIHEFKKELKYFGFDHIYICPHSHREGCTCRKPGTGMLIQAAKDHHLRLSNCVVIGDRWSDMVAAYNAGCKKIIVKTGAGYDALGALRHKWSTITPDFIADNFKDAVNWLCSSMENE